MKIKLSLPLPPSINCLYHTDFKNKTRHKSKKYREWIEECDSLIEKTYTCKGTEKISVVYVFCDTWFNKSDGMIKKKDVESGVKAVSDYLPRVIAGFDDRQIFEMILRKSDGGMKQVQICIEEI